MNFRTYASRLFGLLLLVMMPTVEAVEVDPGGSGQVLLLPLWTTSGGHSTLLNIQNVHETGSQAKIAKLRLLDQDGAVVFSGNLYFHGGQDAWTAGIGSREGGGSRLVTSDETCLLVDGPLGGVKPFGGAVDIDADYGSAEVILMGSGWSVPAAQQYPQQWDTICSQLADKWNSGEWADNPNTPHMNDAYQLFAEWLIVQVAGGVVYKVPGLALDGYSDQVQHTRPGAALPDLASGHDAGTDEGRTTSRVCSNSLCREDTWPTPLDAMAAAMNVDHFRGSYNINPAAGAATDLVLNYPLLKYFNARDGLESLLGHSMVQMATYDRTGDSRVGNVCPGAGIPCRDTDWIAPFESYHPDGSNTYQRWVLAASPLLVVSFNPADSYIAPSEVLGLPGAWRMELVPEHPFQFPPMAPEGSFHARPNELALNYGYTLQAEDGFLYRGAPAIPVVFQRYVNGVLQGGDGVPQRANYSIAFAPASWAWPITWDDSPD
ncbi:MAG: hypothetical protein KDI75_07340 [Xanthomonadales bacterium]|nr:hypothetical protein [Xanthomonadales bacterium]